MHVGDLWPTLRGVLVENFSFYDIKRLCAESGLPVDGVAHLQQKSGSSVSKGLLVDGLDQLVNRLEAEARDRFVSACIEEILKRAPAARSRLEEVLPRVGWAISGNTPYPLVLSVDLGLSELPEDARRGLENALKRYRDGDVAGAITAICGMIDDVAKSVTQIDLADSFQERVSKAFRAREAQYVAALTASSMSDEEVRRVWQNQAKSVSQAAYVVGALRREFADVHGWKSASPQLAQSALDNATYLLRSLIYTGGALS